MVPEGEIEHLFVVNDKTSRLELFDPFFRIFDVYVSGHGEPRFVRWYFIVL